MMRQARIDWKTVQHKMVDMDIRSKRDLADKAKIHYNTLYSEGPYMSTTVDKLAALFGCNHEDLLTYVDAPPPKNHAALVAAN